VARGLGCPKETARAEGTHGGTSSGVEMVLIGLRFWKEGRMKNKRERHRDKILCVRGKLIFREKGKGRGSKRKLGLKSCLGTSRQRNDTISPSRCRKRKRGGRGTRKRGEK